MTIPRSRQTYGDLEVDKRLTEVLSQVGSDTNDDLIRAMLVSALDMDAANVDRLELKIASQSLVEMLNAWSVFSPYREAAKVSIFGSARTKPEEPDYQLAARFGQEMTRRGWMAITGAGPGIMTAGIEGAGREHSFGVNIALPFEQEANEAIHGDAKLATFKYFFTRKLTFMKESDAFALLPGGYGTMDETFELLTLIQTGKSFPTPIVLLDHEDSTYWSRWVEFITEELLGRGMINPSDLNLFHHTHDPAEAADYLCSFYTCYHSIRFVGKRLVIRLTSPLTDGAIDALNAEFSDILASGRIERAETTKAELRDDDHPALPRLRLHFNERSYSGLVSMIWRINELSGLSQSQQATPGLIHDLAPDPSEDAED